MFHYPCSLATSFPPRLTRPSPSFHLLFHGRQQRGLHHLVGDAVLPGRAGRSRLSLKRDVVVDDGGVGRRIATSAAGDGRRRRISGGRSGRIAGGSGGGGRRGRGITAAVHLRIGGILRRRRRIGRIGTARVGTGVGRIGTTATDRRHRHVRRRLLRLRRRWGLRLLLLRGLIVGVGRSALRREKKGEGVVYDLTRFGHRD